MLLLASLALGGAVVAVCLTIARRDGIPFVGAVAGWSVAMLVAALARLGLGHAQVELDSERFRAHREEPGSAARTARRLFGWALDVGVCAGIAVGLWAALDESLPRVDPMSGGWFSPLTGEQLTGAPAIRNAVTLLGTSDAAWLIGPLLSALVIGLYLLPAVVARGGTPAMLLLGLRWVQGRDGAPLGAGRGVLRALARLLAAPVHLAFALVPLLFTRRLPREGLAAAQHRRSAILFTRRSLADLICATETVRLTSRGSLGRDSQSSAAH